MPASGDQAAFVPHLSLNAALALTLISVLVMIYFVHHVPETINVSNITAALGRRLEIFIRSEIEGQDPNAPAAPVPDGAPLAQPCLAQSGYVQSLDTIRLRDLAKSNGWAVLLRVQPGDFVTSQTPVVEVYPARADTPPDAAQNDALRACFALGDERTEDQNPSFLVDQLVEMTARAMSSGVNDPFTARDCLNRMFAALDVALNRQSGLAQTDRGSLGEKTLTFAFLLECWFGASLPYVAGDPMAQTHMRDPLARLRPSARSEQERTAIDELSAHRDEAQKT